MTSEPIILFDGVCNLCNGAVKFFIRRDKKSIMKFAALQSAAGEQLSKQYGLPHNYLQSFLLIENGRLYQKSTAALRVCRQLPFPWPLLYGCIIVPRFIRDGVYDFIARHRYKWFGHRGSCMVPTPELRARFL